MRWQISFNFVVLRMISFTMDYYYKKNEKKTEFQSHLFKCTECDPESERYCESGRIQKGHTVNHYNLFNYYTYLLYAPLYLAGPIISFNNFIYQLRKTPKTLTIRQIALYSLRWVGLFLLMELMMHFLYVVAIKDTKAWKGFGSLEIFTLGYFNLNVIYLKLMVMWRFFRLWAMVDGIETQENMTQCITNQYSCSGFWKGWHASYNKWLIRYLYIPLGGAQYRAFNSFLIFAFVALWHDIQLKMLAWGLLIPLFILPEIISTRYLCTKTVREQLGSWHLHLCAFGGIINLWTMIIANLIGFAVGLDGIMEMGAQLFQPSGILFI
ncbi:membrane bound O-acyl transferase [Globomyces pollinis-pini]|nr:membrane bound O-acyl transferase [Globomyces pollinis-pini]